MARHEKLSVNELTVNKIVDKTSGTSASTNHQGEWKFFDDFNYLAGTLPTTISYLEGSGTAATGVTTAGAGGIFTLVTDNDSGVFAVDGAELVVPYTVDPTSDVTMEARIAIASAITGCSVNVGFSDVATLQESFAIATATVSDGVAEDAVGFVYDDGATSKTWHATVAPGGTISTSYDTTTEAGTGAAPVADTYQILKIVVTAGGTKSKFYVNNVLVKTLTHTALDNPMYPVISVNSTTTAAKTLHIDYVKVIATRA